MGTRQRRNLGLWHRCLRCTVTSIFLSKAGKKDQELNVLVKGGKLKVTYRSDNHVFLKGPATHVFDGVIEIPEEILDK